MKVYWCPQCKSSDLITICRVDDKIEFRCKKCSKWFSLKDEPVKDSKTGIGNY